MLLALLALLSLPAPAAELVTHWVTVADGLPTNWTSAVAQDDEGFIWIGGPGTLSRYDGSRVRNWRVPDLSHDEVGEVVPLADGRIVILQSHGGISVLENGAWSSLLGPDGSPARASTIFRGGRGQLHLVTGGILWALEADNGWSQVLSQVEGLPLHTATAGRGRDLLVATSGAWYRLDSSGQTTLLVVAENPLRAAVHGDTTWLQAASPTRLWHHRDGVATLVYSSDAIMAHSLSARPGEAWLLSHAELVRVEADGDVEVIPHDGSRMIRGPSLVDGDGAIWFNSFEGLALVPYPDLRRWTVSSGLPTNATRFPSRWRNELWLGTWDGIVRFDADGTARPADARVGKGRVCAGDTLWTQVSTFDQGEWLAFDTPDAAPVRHPAPGYAFVLGCDVDEEGAVWLLSKQTLMVARDAATPPQPVADVPLVAGGSMRAVAMGHDGSVHVGANHRVCSSSRSALIQGQATWTCASLPGSRPLVDLHVTERGSVWATTRSAGLLAVTGETATPVPGADQLPVRDLRNVEPSPRGGQWLVGLGAVVRVLDQPGGIEVVETLPEWLGQTLAAIEGIHEDPDGTLWLASNSGLVRVPSQLRDAPKRPPVPRIVEVRVDGVATPARAEVVLPHGASLSVQLAATAYRAPGLVRYRHRLGQADWSAPSSTPALELAALASGQHRLAVQASLDGATWSEQPAQLRLVVQQPWWQRTQAWALLFGLGATMMLGVQGIRTRLRSRAERLRTSVAMDLHDELGAGLASMGLLAGLIATGEAGERSVGLAGRIADDARSLGSNLSGIVWSLRPGHDSLGALIDYIEHRARALLPQLGEDDLGVLRPAGLDELHLDLDVVRAVQLVSLEALANVARHAQAQHVWIAVSREGSQLRLVIEDDGLGLQELDAPRAPDRGLGLQSMATRLAEVGGELILSNRPGGGTRVQARFRPRRPWWRRGRPTPPSP